MELESQPKAEMHATITRANGRVIHLAFISGGRWWQRWPTKLRIWWENTRTRLTPRKG